EPSYNPSSRRQGNHLQERCGSFTSFRTNIRRPPSSRLWNPINYVPRTTAVAAPSPSEAAPYTGTQPEAYPLLTIPEQRRYQPQPSPTSLFVERSVADSGSGRT